MKHNAVVYKSIISSLLLSISVFIAQLLLFSFFIYKSVFTIDLVVVLITAAVIISVFIGTYWQMRSNGIAREAVITGAILLLAYTLLLILFSKNSFFHETSIKVMISIVIGNFLGLFFGERKYYRLRNFRKKRKLYTK